MNTDGWINNIDQQLERFQATTPDSRSGVEGISPGVTAAYSNRGQQREGRGGGRGGRLPTDTGTGEPSRGTWTEARHRGGIRSLSPVSISPLLLACQQAHKGSSLLGRAEGSADTGRRERARAAGRAQNRGRGKSFSTRLVGTERAAI